MSRLDSVVGGTLATNGDALGEVVDRNAWSRRVDDIMTLLSTKLPGWSGG